MKQSKWNKVLVPAVLLIWVGVILRFFGSCSPQEATQLATNSFPLAEDTKKQHSFELKLDYEDPFLSYSPRKQKISSSQPVKRQAKLIPIPPPKSPLRLPQFRYQGGVQSPAGNFTGLLAIDDRVVPIRNGDSISGLLIRHPDLHSVVLVHPDTIIRLTTN